MTILLAAVLAATGYVTDAAGMLDAAGRAALENRVRTYEKVTGTEIAIVTVPSLDGEAVETYANTLFHAWGIGKRGKDNGVLLLWAPHERKVRIEVGYGLEQALPDGRAGQIIREAITPQFRAGRWQDGLTAGVDAIIAQLGSQTASSPAPDGDFPLLALFLIIGGGTAALFAVIYFGTRRRREQRRPYQRREPSYYWQSDPVPVPVVAVDPARPRHSSSSSHHSSSSSSSSSPSWHDSSSSSSGSDSGGFGGGDSGGAGASGSY